MPRLSEETKSARRRQIMDAARACFERRGFSGTSMADIIEESGLSAGSIYSHFGSKDEILRQTAEGIVGAAERALAESGVLEGRVIAPRGMARLVTERLLSPRLIRMFLQFWAEAPLNPELAALVRGNLDRALGLLGRALLPWAAAQAGPGEDAERLARSAASAVMATLHGYFVRLTVDPALDAEALFRDVTRFLPGGGPDEGPDVVPSPARP